MKHTLISIACVLLCLCAPLKAKEKVIDRPPFCVRNTTSIEVSKVVLSDTATVLHIYAKYHPKFWIKIASSSYLKDNNGETYPLRSGIGITPDREFWMPESGEAEFQLVFPPLLANATSIDFSEGSEVEQGFSIWGIQLKSKKLPELELPEGATVHPVDKNLELPQPVSQYSTATVKGKLLDYHPGMTKKIRFILLDPIKSYTEFEANVGEDGSFSTILPVCGTTPAICASFGSPIYFYAEPGKTSELFINQRELSRLQSKFHQNAKPYGPRVYINGPLQEIAQELSTHSFHTNLTETAMEKEDLASFKTAVLETFAQKEKQLEALPICRATRELLRFELDFNCYNALMQAPSMLTQQYVEKNKLDREAGYKYFEKLMQSKPTDYAPTNLLKSLNNARLTLAPSYCLGIIYASAIKDQLAKDWGTDKGVFFDTGRAAKLYRSINEFVPLTAEQTAALDSLPAAYKQLLTEANNHLLQTIEANKKKTGFNINEVGEVSNEDLFASIISKFRGKPLLVDFWATWCGPCRMANKAMKPMKEQLKDKDIVYLYITGETSPLETWKNMIPDIHGEHIRLTNEQWAYLNEHFQIKGVPTYFIIDREGNIKFKQTGFPGVDKMKEELLKVTD